MKKIDWTSKRKALKQGARAVLLFVVICPGSLVLLSAIAAQVMGAPQ